MEAGTLTALVEAVLPRAWRRDSAWHGEGHWRCVTATGLALAAAGAQPGEGGRADGADDVDRPMVLCFGLLHDTRRLNEAVDPEHGARAAAFAEELRGEGLLPLDDDRYSRLGEALERHSDGLVSRDPTIGTCWDADRLHLPRVSIQPRPELLSTVASLGERPLADAAALRASGPPSWEALVAAASSG